MEAVEERNETSFKEMVLSIKAYFAYLLRKWILIVAVAILFGALGVYLAWTTKPKYTAELTFVVDNGSKGGMMGSYAALAAQFGINLGGGGGGLYEGDNILEFLRTKLMISQTLMQPYSPNQLMIDRYMELNETNKTLAGKYGNDAFEKMKYKDLPPIIADSLMSEFCAEINGTLFSVTKPDRKTNFILVKCTTLDPKFSKLFAEKIVQTATDFYVAAKTNQKKSTVDKLQRQADSILYLLNRKTYSTAALSDVNVNPSRKIATVGNDITMRDRNMLMVIYGEIVKNLETAKFALSQETPLVQVVDAPVLPTKKEKPGRLRNLILFGFLGGFLAVAFLTGKRYYDQLMR